MFNQNNYLPGHRTWTMEYNDTRVECSLAVDQFANVSMYLLVSYTSRVFHIAKFNPCRAIVFSCRIRKAGDAFRTLIRAIHGGLTLMT